MKITHKVGLAHQNEICKKLYAKHQVSIVLDLGAGTNPQEHICNDLGIRQLLIDLHYPESDTKNIRRRKVDILDLSALKSAVLEFSGSNQVDCVVSIGNIEHLEKNIAILLLDEIENLAKKLVIFETPNGFVHQGPVDGNHYQIHRSGWLPREFRARGYKVYGTTGLKFLKKNADKGVYKFPIRGMRMLDVILSRIFFVKYFPVLSFNFIAYKVIKPSS